MLKSFSSGAHSLFYFWLHTLKDLNVETVERFSGFIDGFLIGRTCVSLLALVAAGTCIIVICSLRHSLTAVVERWVEEHAERGHCLGHRRSWAQNGST